VVPRLEDLVARGRSAVYADADAGRRSLVRFFARGYWRRVAERPVPLVTAWALLLVPAALAATWALNDPGAASGVVPTDFQAATDPPTGERAGAGEGAAFSSALFTNNIQVSFLAFAGGLIACLGTVFVLLYNGMLFGAVAGLATEAGNGRAFLEFVIAHGVLELSCIVVCAAAGLRMGWALVSPGRARRSEALGAEARRAVEIVLGTAPWLVVAGFVESYLRGTGLAATLSTGIGLGALYWGLVLWRGWSATAAPATSP
jgi:uncharacterized membrane protein SpoIIM required for sporulation